MKPDGFYYGIIGAKQSLNLKEIASFLNEFSLSKVLIIIDELDMNLYLSARNIPNVDVITVREINPVNLLKPQKVAVTSEALKQIEEWINV